MNRKRILFISDSIFVVPTGVANVATNIVSHLSNEFDFFCLGMNKNASNEDETTIRDVSSHFSKGSKVEKLDRISFNDKNVFEFIFGAYKFDAVLLMCDPHFHIEFFKLHHKIKQLCPIIWYNIWDNYPAPKQNFALYDSCDSLLNISMLTQNCMKEILNKDKVSHYVPHGVDLNIFYHVQKNSKEYIECEKYKKLILGENPPKKMLFFNSRNIVRKNIPTLLQAYKLLLDKGYDIGLLLHTAWAGDYYLELYIDNIFDSSFDYKNKIFVTNQELMSPTQMRWLYNICDITILPSYNEGWGLSLTESLACNKPFVATYTGGMIDQINAVYCEYQDCPTIHVKPSLQVSTGQFPLNNSYPSSIDICDTIVNILVDKGVQIDYRKVAEKYFDVNKMTSSISRYVNEAIDKFIPHKKYTITKC